MANLFDMKGGEYHAVTAKIAERLTPQMGRAILDDPDLVDVLVEALKAEPRFSLVHGLFTPVLGQVETVRSWSAKCGWGFTEEQFSIAARTAPTWPKGRLVAVTLVPYLRDDVQGREGFKRTFDELWRMVGSSQNGRSHTWASLEVDGLPHLRLRAGCRHLPGLRWEIVDLGARVGDIPAHVRNSASLHAAVLAAAAIHPHWVKAMGRKSVPHVWMPGYETRFGFGNEKWDLVPEISFHDGVVSLGAASAEHRTRPNNAVPLLVHAHDYIMMGHWHGRPEDPPQP